MSNFTSATFSARIRSYLGLFWKENRQFFLLLFCIVFFKSAIADLSSISGASARVRSAFGSEETS